MISSLCVVVDEVSQEMYTNKPPKAQALKLTTLAQSARWPWMTPEGKVYTLVRQESLNGMHSVEFLTHLLRVTGKRLLVIWDGSPIHRRVLVREFVDPARGKIWLETLPGYAPDLNPWDEGGWHHLKDVEMRNLVCHDLEELHEEFHFAIGRLRRKPHLVRSFFAQAGLKLGKT
jgi:transposase